MKVLVVIFMLGASTATAHAQYPWCLQSDAFDGDRSCAYATFEQCFGRSQLLERVTKLDISTTDAAPSPLMRCFLIASADFVSFESVITVRSPNLSACRSEIGSSKAMVSSNSRPRRSRLFHLMEPVAWATYRAFRYELRGHYYAVIKFFVGKQSIL